MTADQSPATTVGVASAQNPGAQQRFARPTLLHHDAGPYHLAVLRIAVFTTWIVVIGRLPMRNLELLPSEMIEPRGIMHLVPLEALAGSPGLFLGLQAAALLGCVACILGLRPFLPIALTTVGLLLVLDGAAKGIGGHNHAQTALLYTALIVAVFPAADAWSVGPRRRARARSGSTDSRSNRWLYVIPMQAAALGLATAYSFIGARRLIWGGPEVVTGESTTIWLVTRSMEYAAYSFDLGLRTLDAPAMGVVITIGMLTTSVFELLTPLALLWRRFRFVWLAVIVPFHFATLLTMNIFFWENLLLIAVLFTGLTGWIVKVRGPTR